MKLQNPNSNPEAAKLMALAARTLVLAAGIWSLGFEASAANLQVEILPRFGGAPLVFDSVTNRTAAGQYVSVTRLDFLISNLSLRREDGSWLGLTNWQAYLSALEGRTSFQLAGILDGRYEAVRFLVGLTPDLNRADPAQYPPTHPLNPNVNGLHWGWQGGYVFLALEGRWAEAKSEQGYSFHIANDPQLMTVELPLVLELKADQTLRLALDVAKIMDARYRITLAESNATSHSRPHDPLAAHLHENIESAFNVESLTPAQFAGIKVATVNALVASHATPYRLVISSFFPRPALPLDNPLTEEGVELGRRLFFDPRLSVNNRQSCGSCHQASAAFSENKSVSVGAEGHLGTRNAMPLFNLAWKSSFFWDGRAPTLRDQVLQPIQNPIEMHETLTNIVAKLQDFSPLFARAFGGPQITSDRIARALEQFLLTQTSHDSKFDRVLKGEAQFSEEEQRGFELFHTEYDPRREQFGADCFHCHGGPLFQNVAFANNGLDADPKDLGRFLVSGKDGDKGKFAVPSLRNVELTGPYMHDGRFKTLEEVVEHYSTGVKRSSTLDPNLAKHPAGGIPLSQADKKALVSFLKTLTDSRYQSNRAQVAQTP